MNKKEKDQQIQLHELMGRYVLDEFLKHKTDLQLTHQSKLVNKDHWDVCLSSANTLSMISELKVNYWRSPYSGYTAGIKLRKFKGLFELGNSNKAKQNNCIPYIIFFHFNTTWIVNLNLIYKAFKNKDGRVKLKSKMQNNTTAYNDGEGMYTYAQFPVQDFGQRIDFKFDYKDLRVQTLKQAKIIIHPNISWMDTTHFWID